MSFFIWRKVPFAANVHTPSARHFSVCLPTEIFPFSFQLCEKVLEMNRMCVCVFFFFCRSCMHSNLSDAPYFSLIAKVHPVLCLSSAAVSFFASFFSSLFFVMSHWCQKKKKNVHNFRLFIPCLLVKTSLVLLVEVHVHVSCQLVFFFVFVSSFPFPSFRKKVKTVCGNQK